jgi:hypothetical protein
MSGMQPRAAERKGIVVQAWLTLQAKENYDVVVIYSTTVAPATALQILLQSPPTSSFPPHIHDSRLQGQKARIRAGGWLQIDGECADFSRRVFVPITHIIVVSVTLDLTFIT